MHTFLPSTQPNLHLFTDGKLVLSSTYRKCLPLMHSLDETFVAFWCHRNKMMRLGVFQANCTQTVEANGQTNRKQNNNNKSSTATTFCTGKHTWTEYWKWKTANIRHTLWQRCAAAATAAATIYFYEMELSSGCTLYTHTFRRQTKPRFTIKGDEFILSEYFWHFRYSFFNFFIFPFIFFFVCDAANISLVTFEFVRLHLHRSKKDMTIWCGALLTTTENQPCVW